MSYFQIFHFSIFSFPEAFFRKTLHFRSSALWNVLFPKFSFFDFQLPRSFFSQKRCISGVLHSGMSYFQSFHFSIFSFPEAFFAKRCISGVLHSGMSYFQSFHFSIFRFPEAFFPQNAAFPEFCTLERLIPKVFFFLFLLSSVSFFCKNLTFRSHGS